MPVIKPVSDLRNYNTVLQDVDLGVPVFLTKNGRGRYVLLDIADYERWSFPRLTSGRSNWNAAGSPAKSAAGSKPTM